MIEHLNPEVEIRRFEVNPSLVFVREFFDQGIHSG